MQYLLVNTTHSIMMTVQIRNLTVSLFPPNNYSLFQFDQVNFNYPLRPNLLFSKSLIITTRNL